VRKRNNAVVEGRICPRQHCFGLAQGSIYGTQLTNEILQPYIVVIFSGTNKFNYYSVGVGHQRPPRDTIRVGRWNPRPPSPIPAVNNRAFLSREPITAFSFSLDFLALACPAFADCLPSLSIGD
jgi:hypothetical protein